MKTVLCAYAGCSKRRVHYERPDEQREHRVVDVDDAFTGKAYCSIECSMYDQAAGD